MEKIIKVQMEQGLEARPAAELVQVASRYESSVYLEVENKRINAKSIMGMMTLGLTAGEEVHVIVQGEDASKAIAAIEEFLTGR